jgi:hypothetical protein
MIKTFVNIEEILNMDSGERKFRFKTSLRKPPLEMEMNYAQLVRFVFVQSFRIYVKVLFSSCFGIFRIAFLSYPCRKINQLYQSLIYRKFKNKKYEYTNC